MIELTFAIRFACVSTETSAARLALLLASLVLRKSFHFFPLFNRSLVSIAFNLASRRTQRFFALDNVRFSFATFQALVVELKIVNNDNQNGTSGNIHLSFSTKNGLVEQDMDRTNHSCPVFFIPLFFAADKKRCCIRIWRF